MSVVTRVPEPNLWNEICQEYASWQVPFNPEDDGQSVVTQLEDYDPSKVSPVLYGRMHCPVQGTDANPLEDFDASVSHPALAGAAFLERPPMTPPPTPPPLPDKETCSPTEYLESYVFPTLLPVLEQMLQQAKKEHCFEWKRTKFNAMDFITEHLYRNNVDHPERSDMKLEDIPFVQEWWNEHPRAPLPMSLLWSEEEATLIIQSFWRGYKVRREPGVQELRHWQREWREENGDIKNKVDNFWAKQMPGGDQSLPQTAEGLSQSQGAEASTSQAGSPVVPKTPPTTQTASQDSVQVPSVPVPNQQEVIES